MTEEKLQEISALFGTIQNSIEEDLGMALAAYQKQSEGGYFLIPREIFAYVDFIGALYSGYDGSLDRSGRKRITSSRKAIRFLKEVMGKVDAQYDTLGELVYEMYRHGTVHLNRPHLLKRKSDGATIEWLVYKNSPRKNYELEYDGQKITVSHMHPYLFDSTSKRYILPISMEGLYEDLLSALGVYRKALMENCARGDKELFDNFQSVRRELVLPDSTETSW